MSEPLPSASNKRKPTQKRAENKAQSGSAFGKHELIRQLYSMLEKGLPTESTRFSERLTQNLDFAHSLKLSEVPAVLKGMKRKASQQGWAPVQSDMPRADQLAAAYQRVHQAIQLTIEQSFSENQTQARIPLPAPKIENGQLSLAACLTFYQAHQQEMSAKIQGLRRYLRETLAPVSLAMAQLVYLDSALEETVGLPLRTGFANISQALQVYREKTEQQCLQQKDQTAQQQALLTQFYAQLQQLLLAECELRLQPVIGLIEAFNQEVRQAQ